MLYTEEAVRANIRNRDGKRVFFLGEKDTLTPGARDLLTRERIEIRPTSQAAIREYRLLSGAVLTEKPEQMTHLYGDVLVPKTHPELRFGGPSIRWNRNFCGAKHPSKSPFPTRSAKF